jgi:hypothetical protein
MKGNTTIAHAYHLVVDKVDTGKDIKHTWVDIDSGTKDTWLVAREECVASSKR